MKKDKIRDILTAHFGWQRKESIDAATNEIAEFEKQAEITDADIEAYFNSHATEVVNNGYSVVGCMRRDDVYSFVKAVLNGEINHIEK